MKKKIDDHEKIENDPERVVVVDAKTYRFWLNEEDDVYEELYRKKESDAGSCFRVVPR